MLNVGKNDPGYSRRFAHTQRFRERLETGKKHAQMLAMPCANEDRPNKRAKRSRRRRRRPSIQFFRRWPAKRNVYIPSRVHAIECPCSAPTTLTIAKTGRSGGTFVLLLSVYVCVCVFVYRLWRPIIPPSRRPAHIYLLTINIIKYTTHTHTSRQHGAMKLYFDSGPDSPNTHRHKYTNYLRVMFCRVQGRPA